MMSLVRVSPEPHADAYCLREKQQLKFTSESGGKDDQGACACSSTANGSKVGGAESRGHAMSG